MRQLSLLQFLLSALLLALHVRADLIEIESKPDNRLYLTPLIENGKLDEARTACKNNKESSNIVSDKVVESCSGYLTIDKATNSNLFFWFFQAQENAEGAPIIVWTGPIPGSTCFDSALGEVGPFSVGADGTLKERKLAWTADYSLLFIDVVWAGFSFADTKDAYASTSEDAADQIYKALEQFFTLFSNCRQNPIFLAGGSYGGTFMTHLGQRIHMENEKAESKMNLKGLILKAPYLSFGQSRKEDFLYCLGLITAGQKEELRDATDEALELHKAGKDREAGLVVEKIHLKTKSMLDELTSFKEPLSALKSTAPADFQLIKDFVNTGNARNWLHSGSRGAFNFENNEALGRFTSDIFEDHTKILENLLNQGYCVLICQGQFDLRVIPDKMRELVAELTWNGADEFHSTLRKAFFVDGEVAAYVQEESCLTFALIRNAGSYAFMDQPEWSKDLVDNFIAGKDSQEQLVF